jgi:L,D-transpeptidase catalytic domain
MGTQKRMNRRQFGRIAAAAAGLRLTPSFAQRVDSEQLSNGEFNWRPDRSPTGPVIVIVSLPDQRVYVYRDGVRIAVSTCSTGKLGHRTPTGVFKILQKDKNHHSSTYNNAPMPYMNRLTWSGIALHAGQLPGYPASHGCVRLPKEFAELLFGVTKLGMTVVIADDASQPEEVTHPGMVLGEYAAREFHAVDTAVMASEYSEAHERAPDSPSVVISSADKSIHVFDNGALAASGKVEIKNPEKPLGERVFTLDGADDQSDVLTWQAADIGASAKTTGEDNGAALRRIKADPPAREAVRKRLKFGMTIVTTDQPADARTRSRDGFVVLDSRS